MSFLKEEEYDFEQRDMFGETPLLSQLSHTDGQSLEMVRLLLEFGVEIHASGGWGPNALQCAMGSLALGEDAEQRKIVEQKLCLLIKAGADVNHCDKDGLHHQSMLELILHTGMNGAEH